MLATDQITPSRADMTLARTSQSLILWLLLVRVLNGLIVFLVYNVSPMGVVLANSAYTVATYLLTAILIWREREYLSRFMIGKLAVIIFILSKPFLLLATALGFLTNLPPVQIAVTLIHVPVSIWLGLALLRGRKMDLVNRSGLPRWVLIGAFTGILLAVFNGYLITLQSGSGTRPLTLLAVLLVPAVQVANAAVYEEPLFRGFLWGWLRKQGWRDVWIWLAQAGLFWLGHLYYLGKPEYTNSFWIIVPLGGLVLGWIAWRARDIAPSMIAHGLSNGLSQIIGGTW